jgi:hypothetical protein
MSRCVVCRIRLDDTARKGSLLDPICNELVNPRERVRLDSYRQRVNHWVNRWVQLRQGRPGWGQYAAMGPGVLAAADERYVAAANARLYEAPTGGMGRGPKR